eukprot:sb/3464933/
MGVSVETDGEKREAGMMETYGLPLWTYPLTIIFVILFAICVEWDPKFAEDTISGESKFNADKSGIQNYWTRTVYTNAEGGLENYVMYMNTAVMCLIGFGFLYVFSKFYVWGGVGLNFFICGLGFLWVFIVLSLVTSMFNGAFEKVQINCDNMMLSADITAAVLISFGAFYGFTSPSQIILITMLEIFMCVVNEHIVLKILHVKDQGGSMIVHAFGAYFGVATVFGMGLKSKHLPEKHRTTTYFSDMGAMLGTVVLWVYWPSFNAASLYGDTHVQGRVIGNTYLSICASCVTAFATSALIHRGKFEMIEIQNGTLAGGVIIGTISPFLLDPWAPVLIGAIGGVLSTFGYGLLHPFLEDCGILDSAVSFVAAHFRSHWLTNNTPAKVFCRLTPTGKDLARVLLLLTRGPAPVNTYWSWVSFPGEIPGLL